MKFRDNKTGATLETTNEFVIAQYKKYSDRYKEMKIKKPVKSEE